MLLTFSSLIPVIPESRSSLLEKFSSHPSHIHTSTLLSHTDCMWKENDKGRHEHSSVARSPTGYKTKEMTVVKPPQSFCSQQFSINVGESCFPARRWRQYKMKTKNEMCQGNSSNMSTAISAFEVLACLQFTRATILRRYETWAGRISNV